MSLQPTRNTLSLYLLALLLGGLYCLGFAPIDWWPATLIAIAGLFHVFNRPGVNLALAGWLFGVGKYAVGASWVYVSINVYGGASAILALVLVALFVMFVSLLFCMPLGWLYGRWRTDCLWRNLVLFAGAWAFFDWALTWLLTGFPWLYAANALLGTQFSGWLPVLGVVGASALVVFSSAAIATAVQYHRRRPGLVLAALLPWFGGALLGQVAWVQPVREHTVALVQGNLDQTLKWRPDRSEDNFRRHLSLTQPNWDADLIIWPEAAITEFPQRAQRWIELLTTKAIESRTSLIVGMPEVEARGEQYLFYNMALGLGEAKGRFRKHHLVPFGEYVPLEGLLRGLITFFDLPMSANSAGPPDQPNLQSRLGEIAMAICYEVAYPESMRRSAKTAGVLATISNDTWFGASFGPHQHLDIARARALENGRWMLRATNNGLTAIVTADGNIADVLPQFEPGVLRGSFQVMTGRTPYNVWGHSPLLLGWLLLVLFLRRKAPVSTRAA